MGTRKPPSEFTIKRGKLIERARREAGLSQARLAELIGLKSREIISQYESGKIHEITERNCAGLVAILGLLPENLLEDPSVYQFSKDAQLAAVSNEARRVARKWDSLSAERRALLLLAIESPDAKVAPAKQVKRKHGS